MRRGIGAKRLDHAGHDPARPVHDVLVSEPDEPQPHARQRVRAPPIVSEVRPIRVMLESIEFHDQDAFDEQVNPADALEVHLRLHVQPVYPQQNAGDCLQGRFAVRVGEGKQRSGSCGRALGAEPGPEFVHSDSTAGERAVHDDEGGHRGQTAQCLRGAVQRACYR